MTLHPDLRSRQHPIVSDLEALAEYYEAKADRARRAIRPVMYATTQEFVAQASMEAYSRAAKDIRNLIGGE